MDTSYAFYQTTVDPTPVTEIESLKVEISSLNKILQSKSNLVTQYRSMHDAVKSFMFENWDTSDPQDVITSIADLLEIELTRTVEFSGTINIRGSVDLPIHMDSDDIAEKMIVDIASSSDYDGIIDIESIDVEVE
jgi:hypothetical protein